MKFRRFNPSPTSSVGSTNTAASIGSGSKDKPPHEYSANTYFSSSPATTTSATHSSTPGVITCLGSMALQCAEIASGRRCVTFVFLILLVSLGVFKLTHGGESPSASLLTTSAHFGGGGELVEDSIHRHHSISSIFGRLHHNANAMGIKDDEESNYIVVGVRGNPDFATASSRVRKLKSSSHVRVFALPSHDQFLNWLRRRGSAGVIPFPVDGGTVVVVFVHDREGIRFLTSDPKSTLLLPSTDVKAAARGGDAKVVPRPQRETDEKRLDLKNEDLTVTGIVAEERVEEPEKLVSEPTNKEEPREENEGDTIRISRLERSSVSSSIPTTREPQLAATTTTSQATPRVLPPPLVAQTQLRNKIITGYRAAEGKKFTNYKPIAQAMTAGITAESERAYGRKENPNYRNWRFVYQGPALASIVLVQDLTSARIASEKNQFAIINNIGWSGQACLGGSKGAQIKCRIAKATSDGCEYYSLGIQPPQYRMWIEEEARHFFETVCRRDGAESALWIEKPSGGQHGAGMSVHRGCKGLRARHHHFSTLASSSTSESSSSTSSNSNGIPNVDVSSSPNFQGKKYFVMEYLEPALLDGHKFDVRSYMLIASLSPELVFYHDGFVRRATNKYSRDNLKDKTAHITNSMDQDAADDHFWDFERLSDHLHRHSGFPPNFMTTRFRISAKRASNFVYQSARSTIKKRPRRFQLFAIDWIVDANGNSHMLEVNANPLVSTYPIKGFPQIWGDMIDLILDLHVNPGSTVFGKKEGRKPLVTKPEEMVFVHNGWELVFNSEEEKVEGKPYNACEEARELRQRLGEDPVVNGNANQENPSSSANSNLGIEVIQEQLKRESLDEMMIEREEQDEALLASGFDADYLKRPIPSWVPLIPHGERQSYSLFTFDAIMQGKGSSNPDEERLRRAATDVLSQKSVQGERVCGDRDSIADPVVWRSIGGGGAADPSSSNAPHGTSSNSDVSTRLVTSCYLMKNTPDETVFHMVDSGIPGPTIVIVGGMHGNEAAGVIASRHVARNWIPVRGRFLIFERANARGVASHSRLVPASHASSSSSTDSGGVSSSATATTTTTSATIVNWNRSPYDLNRNFPLTFTHSTPELARSIFRVIERFKPRALFDLHEGRSFNRFSTSDSPHLRGGSVAEEERRAQEEAEREHEEEIKVIENVGSTTSGHSSSSKGSSVICSTGAEGVAKLMVDSVNQFISDSNRHFTVISPPITNGLASKVAAIDYVASYSASATSNNNKNGLGGPMTFVMETTLVLPLEVRVRQHLLMLATALRSFHVLSRDFDFDMDQPPESCVAGRKSCQYLVFGSNSVLSDVK